MNRELADVLNGHTAGYSPEEMWVLVNDPFGEGSPLQLKPIPEDVCEQIPLFRQIYRLLEILYAGGEIKLTQKGNLPLKVVQEISEFGVPDKITEDGYAFRSEIESESVPVAREVKRIRPRGAGGRTVDRCSQETQQQVIHHRKRRTDFLRQARPLRRDSYGGLHDLSGEDNGLDRRGGTDRGNRGRLCVAVVEQERYGGLLRRVLLSQLLGGVPDIMHRTLRSVHVYSPNVREQAAASRGRRTLAT